MPFALDRLVQIERREAIRRSSYQGTVEIQHFALRPLHFSGLGIYNELFAGS